MIRFCVLNSFLYKIASTLFNFPHLLFSTGAPMIPEHFLANNFTASGLRKLKILASFKR